MVQLVLEVRQSATELHWLIACLFCFLIIEVLLTCYTESGHVPNGNIVAN